MSKSNRHIRAKRAERRAGSAGAERQAPLVPHTRRCPCAACEDRRKQQLCGDIEDQRKRRRDYDVGHAHPEHRSGWAVTVHALSAFMSLHECDFDRRAHVTHLQMSDEFLDYLEHGLDQGGLAHDLDPGRLYDAFVMLGATQPTYWRIVQGCVIEGRTQSEVGAEMFMSQQAVSRNLEAAAGALLDQYAGLKVLDAHHAAAS